MRRFIGRGMSGGMTSERRTFLAGAAGLLFLLVGWGPPALAETASITITSPAAGSRFVEGRMLTLKWTSAGLADTEQVNTRFETQDPPRSGSTQRWPPNIYDPAAITAGTTGVTGTLPSVSSETTCYLIVELVSNPAVKSVVSFTVADRSSPPPARRVASASPTAAWRPSRCSSAAPPAADVVFLLLDFR
jgi:hypothetical protein